MSVYIECGRFEKLVFTVIIEELRQNEKMREIYGISKHLCDNQTLNTRCRLVHVPTIWEPVFKESIRAMIADNYRLIYGPYIGELTKAALELENLNLQIMLKKLKDEDIENAVSNNKQLY